MARREARGRPACWCRRHSLHLVARHLVGGGFRPAYSPCQGCGTTGVRNRGRWRARECRARGPVRACRRWDLPLTALAYPPRHLHSRSVMLISNAKTIDRGCVTVPMLDAAYFTRCEWEQSARPRDRSGTSPYLGRRPGRATHVPDRAPDPSPIRRPQGPSQVGGSRGRGQRRSPAISSRGSPKVGTTDPDACTSTSSL